MENIEAFKDLINSPGKIVITTHQKPDADALGSSLGLGAYLRKRGHDVQVITPTDYPDFLTWMEGNDNVLIDSYQSHNKVKRLVQDADIIFCLDFSSLHRIGKLGELVNHSKAKKVLIDHHLDKDDFADFEMWNTKAAATAELIYDLIVALGHKEKIDPGMAEALYAGIMTDTGSFKHSNTSVNVFQISAELIKAGADVNKVARLIYDTNSVDKLRFLGHALVDKLVVREEYKTAFIAIDADELIRFNSKTGDTEGLVNYALSIEGVVFAAVIIERKDMVKISFRSVGDFSVNEFAKDNFEGGGHKNASGGKSMISLAETVKKFESLLPKYQEKLCTNLKPHTTNVEN